MTKKLTVAERLDVCIKESLGEDINNGYSIDGKADAYTSYQTKSDWKIFKKEMEEVYPAAFEQFGKGGGKELEEKEGKPPKMASFASSSRMMYLLARNRAYFEFEKKLPTTVGGIANLDGYLKTIENYIFVEAKCREPYGHSSKVKVGQKYEKFYEALTKDIKDLCIVNEHISGSTDMISNFSYGGESIDNFDIKQMISHLCGIATAVLKGEYGDKPIKFLYLLFNPTDITDDEEMLKIYDATCKQCLKFDFVEMFAKILDILPNVCSNLKIKENLDLDYVKNNFCFELCDQNEFKNLIF